MNDFVDAFKFIGHNTKLLEDSTVETLKLFAAGFGIALVIALPLGVWLGHLHRGQLLAINLSNIGRALPSLAIISIFVGVFGLGFLNMTIALVILAVPVMLTNAFVAVDGVDRDLVQAARGMGMRGTQVLWRVELPLAIPLIFAGMRTAALYVMATTPLAAFVGVTGGLGDIIANQASYGFDGVIAASIVIAVLAFLAEGIFALIQHFATPRGVRGQRIRGGSVAPATDSA